MTGTRFKWATHLEAAEGSGLRLAAYAQKHRIDVHRLYEVRQLRKLQGTTAWSVVRVKEQATFEVSSKVLQRAAPNAIAMQARLGNGVVLSWPAGKIRAKICHIGFPSELVAWKRRWLALVRSTVLSLWPPYDTHSRTRNLSRATCSADPRRLAATLQSKL